jgi:hypothetical protein
VGKKRTGTEAGATEKSAALRVRDLSDQRQFVMADKSRPQRSGREILRLRLKDDEKKESRRPLAYARGSDGNQPLIRTE